MARVPVIWHVRDRISPDTSRFGRARFPRSAGHMPSFVIANSAATLDTILPQGHRSRGIPGDGRRACVVHDAVVRATPRAPPHPPRTCRTRTIRASASWPHYAVEGPAHIHPRGTARPNVISRRGVSHNRLAMFGEDAYEVELRRLVEECGLRRRASSSWVSGRMSRHSSTRSTCSFTPLWCEAVG